MESADGKARSSADNNKVDGDSGDWSDDSEEDEESGERTLKASAIMTKIPRVGRSM